MRLGIVTFGLGATIMVARGKGDPSEVVIATTTGGSTVTGEATLPAVTTKMTSLVPQLSLNFGRRFGWSYVSAGYGPTRIDSRAAAVGTLPAVSAPDQWNPALNFGGGARWFMKRHIGASFDVRFTKLSSRASTATAAGAKRTQIVSLLVGISLQ
jgi:outer membrane protein W